MGADASRVGYYDDSDEEDEEEEAFLNQPVELTQTTVTNEDKIACHIKAIMGKFLMGRQFRIAFSFEYIIGIRFHVPVCKVEKENRRGVLILELGAPLKNGNDECNFALRRVCSNLHGDNDFKKCDDWTPGKYASNASRHYIYGSFAELHELASYLATQSPRLAEMLSNGGNNSLFSSDKGARIDLTYDGAPQFKYESVNELVLGNGIGVVSNKSLQSLAARTLIRNDMGKNSEASIKFSPVIQTILASEELKMKQEEKLATEMKRSTVKDVKAMLKKAAQQPFRVGFTRG